jgi:hypothetical protein
MKTETSYRNAVRTALSAVSVEYFEHLLYWYWDEFHSDYIVDVLSQMLEICIKADSKSVCTDNNPVNMVRIVSDIIKLNEKLTTIQEMSKPWGWVSTLEGWKLPDEDTLESADNDA